MYRVFWLSLALVLACYLTFWLFMLWSTATYTSPIEVWQVLITPEIRFSTMLSLSTCTAAAVASLIVAVPIAYLMVRKRFPGHTIVDAMLDIPIVLPPMVVGLCLLIFFQTSLGRRIEAAVPFTYTVAGVVLAQWVVAAAFAIRSLRATFHELPARPEEVALTLGCSRLQAVWLVTLPAARPGMIAAASVAWARSLGEFGPVLVFAGATRMKTEVLPTSVWMAWSVGQLEQGIAVSLLMIAISMVILVTIRMVGGRA